MSACDVRSISSEEKKFIEANPMNTAATSIESITYSLRSTQREINIVFLMRGIIVRVELYEGCACGVLRSIWKVLNPFLRDDDRQYKLSLNEKIRINYHSYLSVFIWFKKKIYPRLHKNSKYSCNKLWNNERADFFFMKEKVPFESQSKHHCRILRWLTTTQRFNCAWALDSTVRPCLLREPRKSVLRMWPPMWIVVVHSRRNRFCDSFASITSFDPLEKKVKQVWIWQR